MKRFLLTLLCSCWAAASLAQQEARELGQPYESFGEYKVFYSLFNSNFISPKVAEAYNLVRGNDRALVNISVLKGKAISGSKAKISGSYTNLLQQQRTLEFKQIREQDAVYYLAPLRFTTEDILTINISVTPEGGEQSHRFSFKRKMHVDK
ncbi:MAG: DUF4426 domain-containing protein [Cellvibrionaceae bacterium]|nr:DUF4426 domain-containing protein [Cellvibrionaceae bacterium]